MAFAISGHASPVALILPPDLSGEASQLPWQCQARELERLASKQSATTRNSLQPQRSTACLRRRHLQSRCEPAVRHRLEAGTATHSHTRIADLLEHKSLNIIHELQPLVNKPAPVAHLAVRSAHHRCRVFGRRPSATRNVAHRYAGHPSEASAARTGEASPPVDASSGSASFAYATDPQAGRPGRRRWDSGIGAKVAASSEAGQLPGSDTEPAGMTAHTGPACRFLQHMLECPGRGGEDLCTSIF